MKIKILGSGGCQIIPRPCCQCKICKEAREKGVPFERLGPSMFIEDENILFDTPEEISVELNRADVKKVEHIFYTHWHPDHTAGMRVFEQLNLDWFSGKGEEPIDVYMPENVYRDMIALKNKYGSSLEYWEKVRNLIKIHQLKNGETIVIESIQITPFKIDTIDDENSFLYLIEKDNKKIIYAICDFKNFPSNVKSLYEADLFITQNGYFEGKISEDRILGSEHPLRTELYSFQEVLDISKKIRAKKILFTHVEELWGKSFEDYKEIEKKYSDYNIQFAYDGLELEI